MATKIEQAKNLAPDKLKLVRPQLSDSWKKAAGMFRHHRKALEGHIKQVRNEWDRLHDRV